MSACTDNNFSFSEGTDFGQLPITLRAQYPTQTRASDSGFEDGDKMGIYVLDYDGNDVQDITGDDVHATNVKFVFNEADNTWKSNSNIYWTSKTLPADIIGYYPYNSEVADEKSLLFSVQKRQDGVGSDVKLGGYESSDFLWAKADKVMPTDSRVDLTFRHLMAGVRVTLVEGKGFSESEWESIEKTVVIPNVSSTVNINLEDGSLDMVAGDKISIVPYQCGMDWRAVVVPQKIPAGNDVIDITVDGVSYHLVKKDHVNFVSGKLNSFTITVDKRVDEKGYEFTLTDEAITAWLDEVEFRDGIVRNYISIDVEKKGTLKEIVSRMGISTSAITGLKLTGEINEDDFKFMREECTSLNSLNLSDVSVWYEDRENVIPYRAMYEKNTLAHIIFPKNLKVIGSDAFFRSGLTGSLIIPEGVEKIGEAEVHIDDMGWIGVTNREEGTFAYCS